MAFIELIALAGRFAPRAIARTLRSGKGLGD